MQQRVLLPICSVAAAGLLATAVAAPAEAGPASAGSRLTGPARVGDVVSFWLNAGGERLRQAAPYGLEHQAAPAHVSSAGTGHGGEPGMVVPAPGGGPRAAAASKNLNLPRTVGRVFFTTGDDMYSCSASSVRSRYRNLVLTAGHCVYDVESDRHVVNRWIFVPGYYDGKAPWGVYVGKQAFTHYDFDVYEDGDRDYAFVTVYSGIGYDGRKHAFTDLGPLGGNVGGQGLAYNQRPGAPLFVFGYPAMPHGDGDYAWTGRRLKWCYGRPYHGIREASFKVEEQIGLRCAMTGGSSGGPWITKYSNARRLGYITGVTSLGGDTDGDGRSDMITSPYFDGETYGVYRAASSLWSGSLVRPDGSIGVTEVSSR